MLFVFAFECAYHGANGETMGIKVLIDPPAAVGIYGAVLDRMYRYSPHL